MPPKPAALLAACLSLLPGAALAAHGKVGLWTSTTSVAMQGMPPQSHSSTFCMTAADVKADMPAADTRSGCSYRNASVHGRTYSADMVCKGSFQGTGHIDSTYDSDTHFTAKITMAGDGFNMTNNVEGKWLKADCAGAEQ